MQNTRRGRRRSQWRTLTWAAVAMLVLWTGGCGPLHSPAGDADAESEVDTGPDADGDAGVEPDADEVVDADRVDAEDAEPDVEEDSDFDPTDRTWLHATPASAFAEAEVSFVEPYPAGGFVVAGRRNAQWIARFDSTGGATWSLMIGPGFGLDISSLSVAADGRVYMTAGSRLVAFDGDGRVLWQRQLSDRSPLVRGLSDGSVILFDEYAPHDVMRYSPTEGVLWSRRLQLGEYYSTSEALAVIEGGMIILATGPFVVALDVDGRVEWGVRWSGSSVPVGPVPVAAVAETEVGGIVIAGGGGVPPGRPPTVVRMDTDGRVEWLRTVGTYEPGGFGSECDPRCDTDVAVDVAVGATGEAMVVGYSTSASEVVGAPPYTSLIAIWLGPMGTLERRLAMAERRPSAHSDGLAAAAMPSGEWIVGGHWSHERAVLASLDATGSVGGTCSYIAEPSFATPTEDWALETVDVTLSPSDLEVVEGDPLAFDVMNAEMERLCH